MYLLFDIGGSKTRLTVSFDGETFGKVEIFTTPREYDKGIEKIGGISNRLLNGRTLKAAAGGVRRLDFSKSKLVTDFQLPDWAGKPLREQLSRVLDTPVLLENDTAMVGLGEAVAGSGRGHRIVVYITISTGVGGVRIVDGKIDVSKYGFEIGSQFIDFDWSVLPELKILKEEGSLGQFEAYISGTSIEKRFGMKPHEVVDGNVWREISEWVAVGINNTIVHWSPDVVVLGGGMMTAPGISINQVEEHLRRLLTIFPELPDLRKAELGDVGGLHGALHYIKHHV